MRKKFALGLTVVTMLALSVPASGMAGPIDDVNHEVECISKMVTTHTLSEKLKCIRECARHKLAGDANCA